MGNERQNGSHPARGAVCIEATTAGTWLERAKEKGCSQEGALPSRQEGTGAQSSSV